MKINVVSNYTVGIPKTYETSIDIKGLIEYLEKTDIYSEDDLRYSIKDFVVWENYDLCVDEKDFYDIVEYTEEINITNLNELCNHFKYLIKETWK